MKVLLVISAALLLGGCATKTVWHKPGITNPDAERDKAECTASAYQQFPVANSPPPQTSSGLPAQVNCTTYGNTTSCTTLSSSSLAIQPIDVYQDQNIPPRQSAIKACMYRLGYTLQTVH